MFNYYFDQDRDDHLATVQMFEAIGRGEFEGYTSEYVSMELESALNPKKDEMLSLIKKFHLIDPPNVPFGLNQTINRTKHNF
jgi:hypothetical protein